MSFKFRLESVLTLREHEEKMAKQKLAGMLSELSVTKIEYKLKQDQLRQRHQPASGTRTLQPVEKAFGNHMLISSQELRHMKMKIRQQEEAVERQRKMVIESNRNVKIIEKLKKKALVEYLHEQNRREQAHQNEIATQMYVKQTTSWI
jgi:flagellar biosynthesis chaperone FliJ